LGGLVVIAAAPELDGEPRAIVTLSAEGTVGTKTGRGYGNLDARPAVEGLDAPLLLIAAEGERDDVAVARALFAAASMKTKELEIVPGSAHATALFSDGPAASDVRARTVEFIKQHGG
jgi:pimeloyl-ACP methyl ester carboxylesterase